MALRAVADHPKLSRLKALLKCGRGEAMGYLEALWHFTGRFTPQGNVGKYSDAEIEAWIEWEGNAGTLIAALIESRWIDPDPVHRLLVHDWHDHADDYVNADMARKQITFANGTIPSSRRLNQTEREKYKAWVESNGSEVKSAGRPAQSSHNAAEVQPKCSHTADSLQTVCVESADSPHENRDFLQNNADCQPSQSQSQSRKPAPEEQKQEQQPSPKGVSEPDGSSPRPPVGDVPVTPRRSSETPSPAQPMNWPPLPAHRREAKTAAPEELIYQEYPRKEGHLAAIKAIKIALLRIQKGEGVIPAIPDSREARVYLYRRVQTYARSPAGSQADKIRIPHPKTWFDQARYLDDENNWQHTGEQRYENPKQVGSNNVNLLLQSIGPDKNRVHAHGYLEAGDSGQGDVGHLLPPAIEGKR